MDVIWKSVLWSQFGATIDMFGNAMRLCPDELWTAHMWSDPGIGPEFSEFWYISYHTLFWMDLYLSGSVEGFQPPAPYNLDELDPHGLLPERVYSKEELFSYLEHCRWKCHETIEQLTDEKAHLVCKFTWAPNGISFAELLLDNLRHVQEHAAQLNLFIGQHAGIPSRWVAQTRSDG